MILIVQVYGVQPNSSTLVYSNAIQTVKVITLWFPDMSLFGALSAQHLRLLLRCMKNIVESAHLGCSLEDWNG